MSECEAIHSESEVFEDETAYSSSDEDFINDSEISDSEDETSDEDYIPEGKKQKIEKVEIITKFKK